MRLHPTSNYILTIHYKCICSLFHILSCHNTIFCVFLAIYVTEQHIMVQFCERKEKLYESWHQLELWTCSTSIVTLWTVSLGNMLVHLSAICCYICGCAVIFPFPGDCLNTPLWDAASLEYCFIPSLLPGLWSSRKRASMISVCSVLIPNKPPEAFTNLHHELNYTQVETVTNWIKKYIQ